MRSVIKLKRIVTALFIFLFYLMFMDVAMRFSNFYTIYIDYGYEVLQDISGQIFGYMIFNILIYIPILILLYIVMSSLDKIGKELILVDDKENEYTIMDKGTVFYRFYDYIKVIRFEIIIVLIFVLSKLIANISYYVYNQIFSYSQDPISIYFVINILQDIVIFGFIFVLIYSLSEISNAKRNILDNMLEAEEDDKKSFKINFKLILIIILFVVIFIYEFIILITNVYNNIDFMNFTYLIYNVSQVLLELSNYLLLFIGPLTLIYITLISPFNLEQNEGKLSIIKNESKVNKFIFVNLIVAVISLFLTLPQTYEVQFTDFIYYLIIAITIVISIFSIIDVTKKS